jgi:CRP-like cAMP-binding protein
MESRALSQDIPALPVIAGWAVPIHIRDAGAGEANDRLQPLHLSDARLARYLLMTGDRARSGILPDADVSGGHAQLRRVTVTEIAGRLRRRNLISYGRGKIRILNRQGLEAVSCECCTRIE